MKKYIVAAMVGLFLGSVAGVAGALEQAPLPVAVTSNWHTKDERKLANCVVVKTIETDSKGRTIIIISKSCEVAKKKS